MPDLEQVGPQRFARRKQRRFVRLLGVAHQQEALFPIRHAQDGAVQIQVRIFVLDRRQDVERHLADRKRFARDGAADADRFVGLERVEQVQIGLGRMRDVGHIHVFHAEAAHHLRRRADMVGVRVGEHGVFDLLHALFAQKIGHGVFVGVDAAVDEHMLARRHPQQQPVALSDVDGPQNQHALRVGGRRKRLRDRGVGGRFTRRFAAGRAEHSRERRDEQRRQQQKQQRKADFGASAELFCFHTHPPSGVGKSRSDTQV